MSVQTESKPLAPAITGAKAPRAAATSVQQFCIENGISRSKAYLEIKAGRLRAVKLGHRTLILSEDAEAWRASLPRLSYDNKL